MRRWGEDWAAECRRKQKDKMKNRTIGALSAALAITAIGGSAVAATKENESAPKAAVNPGQAFPDDVVAQHGRR